MSMTEERGWWRRREPNPRPEGTGIEVNLDGPDGAAAGREAASVSGLVPQGAGRPGLAVRRALIELKAPRPFIPSYPDRLPLRSAGTRGEAHSDFPARRGRFLSRAVRSTSPVSAPARRLR